MTKVSYDVTLSQDTESDQKLCIVFEYEQQLS